MPILDFVSKHASVIGREWFRLMEWLLIITTLRFAAELSEDIFIQSLWFISIFILWGYIFFSYAEVVLKWMGPYPQESGDHRKDFKEFLLRGAWGLISGILLLLLAQGVSTIAFEFATKLASELR